jgi:tetratricopeptide (TPR) repeat protein
MSSGNRFAIGAKLDARIGARTAHDELDTQGSYLSQHAVGELAFGLGSATRIDELRVTWPGGATDTFGPIPGDVLVTWTRGSEPVFELLPGKREAALAGPADVSAQRRFYAELDATTRARVAGDLEGAVAGYERALEAWPSHEDCLYNLGNSLLGLGRRDDALAAYRRLVLFHPESNRGWMQIGTWMLTHASPSPEMLLEAERAFGRSHEINKEESQPFVRLGLVALVRGDLARADEMLEQAARLNPQSIEARYLRGRVAWLGGDVERSRALLGEAQELARAKPPTKATGLHEGETRSGEALVARTPATELMDRWRSVADRPLDPAAEYGQR